MRYVSGALSAAMLLIAVPAVAAEPTPAAIEAAVPAYCDYLAKYTKAIREADNIYGVTPLDRLPPKTELTNDRIMQHTAERDAYIRPREAELIKAFEAATGLTFLDVALKVDQRRCPR